MSNREGKNKGMRKRLRWISLLSAWLFLTTICCGCAAAGDSQDTVQFQVELETPPAATDKLIIYQPPDMAGILSTVLPIYKTKFSAVEVEVRQFDHDEDYRTTLSTELMAGQGPDVVLWSNYFRQDGICGSEFADIYKVMNSEIFYNLDNFIANDPDFVLSDYNEAVLDMGVYKGQRQFVPISYGAGVYITSREALESNGFTLSEKPTYDEFYDPAVAYCQKYEDSEENWLLFDSRVEQGLSCLYPINGMELIDYEQEQVNTDSDAFQKTMDTYQKMHRALTKTDRGIRFPYQEHSASAEIAITSGQTIFKSIPATDHTLWYAAEGYCVLSALGQSPVGVSVPNVNGGKTTAFSRQNAAINKAGKNQANAYEFIKILLSDTIQSDCSSTTFMLDIPVRNEARRQKIEILTQVNSGRWYAGDHETVPIPFTDEQVDDIYNLFTDVEPIRNYAVALDEILWKNMEPYFAGTESYEQCVKNLENELKLYVAE